MNRIVAPPAAARPVTIKSETPDRVEVLSLGKFIKPAAEQSVALFTPVHYEANYRYPLLVWLHATGDNEQQLKRIMPLVSLRNYVAVAPRGPRSCTAGGYAWQPDAAHIAAAEDRVFEAIASAEKQCHVHPGRIFLAGFGDAGTAAFRIALNHPSIFAGVATFNGALPEGDAPLRNLFEARRLQLLLSTARDSSDYDVARVCSDLRLCHTAGMSVSLRQYPCGDQLDPQMLSDLDRWMMEQIIENRI